MLLLWRRSLPRQYPGRKGTDIGADIHTSVWLVTALAVTPVGQSLSLTDPEHPHPEPLCELGWHPDSTALFSHLSFQT